KRRSGVMKAAAGLALVLLLITSAYAANPPTVELRRVPDHGLEPSAAVGSNGAIHLVYFTGEAKHGDLWYVRTDDAEHTHFTKPMRVNTDANSAIIMGGVRGPHLALGQNDRAHVLWNGSDQAKPRSPAGGGPLLYRRMNDAGTAFDAERNLLTISG